MPLRTVGAIHAKCCLCWRGVQNRKRFRKAQADVFLSYTKPGLEFKMKLTFLKKSVTYVPTLLGHTSFKESSYDSIGSAHTSPVHIAFKLSWPYLTHCFKSSDTASGQSATDVALLSKLNWQRCSLWWNQSKPTHAETFHTNKLDHPCATTWAILYLSCQAHSLVQVPIKAMLEKFCLWPNRLIQSLACARWFCSVECRVVAWYCW